MQTNSTTAQETPAQLLTGHFGEGMKMLTTSQATLLRSQILAGHEEFTARESRRIDLSGAPFPSFFIKGIHYASQPTSQKLFYLLCKRGLDVTISLALLLLTLPLLVAVALLVKATSPGRVFFAHKRLGLGGREFSCLKFRTMVSDAEEQLKQNELLRRQFQETYKIKNDPRITAVGAFLRRTSLDELPQLWHVLRGEMSLIGPRPVVPPELEKYAIYGKKLLSVKPGLSGLWQVCGRSDTTYARRVRMDAHYIDHRCLLLDVQLLLLTAVVVLKKSGAC